MSVTADGMEPRPTEPRDWLLPVVLVALLFAAMAGLRFAAAPTPTEAPEVADAAPCGACHGAQVEAWRTSHHALAQSDLDAAGPGPLDVPDGMRVVGSIGVDPLVQWMVDDGRGRVQVSQLAVHPASGDRFDVFDDGRQPGEWGHWTGGGMTWNRSCASCHATEVKKGFQGFAYATTFSEAGVGCEACHEGAQRHASGGPPPTGGKGVATCAPCHGRRAELTDGFEPGAPFLDGFAPALIDGGPTGLFYGDGQVREEVFEWNVFATSRMHQVGVGCTNCHDPHSGELLREGDALCTGCHEELAPHDLHDTPVGCVGCHMPVTTYMQRHARHDHGFRLPDPVTGSALGIPDACSRCHADRDNEAAFVAAYGPRGVDERALAFARGDGSRLRSVLEDRSAAPMWRASAAARLGEDPASVDVLRAHVNDPDPLVRFGVWSGLGPWVSRVEPDLVAAGLDDPSRAVRVAVTRAAAAMVDPADPRAADYGAYLLHNGDQPDAIVEHASWALARGRPEAAGELLDLALRLDPQRVSALDAAAVVAAARRRPEEAVRLLERATTLASGDGELWLRLGLARAQAGDPMGAETALVEAARHGAPRAHYNLGLLLAERGAYDQSLKQLFAAEANEDGVDVRYAIASTLSRWGRSDEARIAAKRVLQLDPEHQGARQLLR